MEPFRQPPVQPADIRPIACLGEAIVDLICERNLPDGEEPGAYRPWPGGALANVAVSIARQGVPAALVGGVGGDAWGRRLRRDLAGQGVSVEWLATLDDADTPVALVEFGSDNEPSFNVYGESIGPTMAAVAERLEEEITAFQGLVVGSNTMVGETERQVTRRAVELARDAGIPVLFDPNHRPNRWSGTDPARKYCQELARSATVVKLNRSEAELITGESDPLHAARRLAGLGPDLVVVTAGEDEIVTAGQAEVRHRPAPVTPVSPLGAGDAFMGGLAAGLAGLDWDLGRVGEALPAAARAAGESCREWGAW